MLRIALVCVVACTPPAAPAQPVVRDPHSHAEPERVAIRHLALDLDVDFSARQLRGRVQLSLVRHDRSAALRLDVDGGLAIEAAIDCATRRPLAWRVEPARPVVGNALVVAPADCVELAYHTGADARALLWVEPGGTAGKRAPMLFTQSQSINARTWIPLQDTPGVRFTYDATIRVPDKLWAVMSAENPQSPPADGVWRFRMEHPIPSYLMALAVGDLAFRSIGPRTGVYAEPVVVDAAAHELVEAEAMLATAEELYGPYRWGRYDMLVLPPSFPFGGMENPRLTFLTPTVITGDRALVSLIAHELAHSWSGNLVTNATWSDFWLNEGFTNYIERRIMEELRGEDQVDISWYLARKDLDEAFAKIAPADTRLALAIGADRNPDDVPSDAAYEKGALFLRTLEHAFGRPALDAFMRRRFDRRAFQSTDSRAFEAEAGELLATAPRQLTAAELASWLHDPGLPPTAVPAHSARVDRLRLEADAFARTGTLPVTDRWQTTEWVVFVRALPADLTLARAQALDDAFHLAATPNAEIAMYWLPILVRADARDAAPAVEAFLMRVGRRRMIRPLYEAMIAKGGSWRTLAVETYRRAKPLYHPIVRETLEKLLQLKA